jgi:hypothetical protein
LRKDRMVTEKRREIKAADSYETAMSLFSLT